MRVNAIDPFAPLLLPPVKVKASVALEQLWNVIVPVPMGTLFDVPAVESNVPPVVSYSVIPAERMPDANVPEPVYQR